MFALTQPAREIGGDFYDFLQLGEGRLGLVIGDSSGKGLPAALHAAQSLSVIRGLARRNSDIVEVLGTVNEVLLGSGEGVGMFCTVFYGVFEPAGGRITFANAGHCRPILLRAGRPPAPLEHETSLPVGMLAEFVALEQDTQLEPGDLLVFYSDGVTEARNPDEELFGLQRLIDCLANGGSWEPRRIAECVSRAVSDFTATGKQADDITIVVLEATA
jgi:sigma-B regulation protein RsbU (phosphoserine phosphatase)